MLASVGMQWWPVVWALAGHWMYLKAVLITFTLQWVLIKASLGLLINMHKHKICVTVLGHRYLNDWVIIYCGLHYLQIKRCSKCWGKYLTQAHVAQFRATCVDFDDLFTFPHVKCTYPPIFYFSFHKEPSNIYLTKGGWPEIGMAYLTGKDMGISYNIEF